MAYSMSALAAAPTTPIATTAPWKYKSASRDDDDDDDDDDVTVFAPVDWWLSVVVMVTDRCDVTDG